ncbi:hypothetical protein DERP_006433 [Dermatophagoides pteronyssinus]|uniref:Uncharacterized protein n=1 Tax=Dermatophagoides pteronyssinus TaxID=6956 RepID=A0ABQ8IQH0_DERPT|nr:hypothetical protein DERP_006433 [Dermatophagoides pteronyssinus]
MIEHKPINNNFNIGLFIKESTFRKPYRLLCQARLADNHKYVHVALKIIDTSIRESPSIVSIRIPLFSSIS